MDKTDLNGVNIDYVNIDKEKIARAVKDILEAIGENPDREGLKDTPKRIANMYEEIFRGMSQNAKQHLEIYFQDEHHEELVLVKDIPFHSMCEHHLVPFFGEAHIAYLPKGGRLTGLSKLARVVETVSRRPQLQERLTTNVADTIMEVLSPFGVVVIVEAEHMCMTMRGVKKAGSKTVTSAIRGAFRKDIAAREEVMDLIINGKRS